MSDADRDDSGKYTATVADETILATIDQAPGHVGTASELAEDLPIGRRAVRERLLALKEQGAVDRKKVGGRAVVWWLTEDEPTATEIDPDDPLFSAPTFTTDEPIDEEDIDDVLYGEVDG
jgi:predicted ArsR family transcriptional regulator